MMDEGKKFKDAIEIEKNEDEIENEKKVEAALQNDEDRAS